MTDDRREEIPLVPRDELREATASAPQTTSLSAADKQRLEALLRELLRDTSIRELLGKEKQVSAQSQAGN
jgi:hypothetical protein